MNYLESWFRSVFDQWTIRKFAHALTIRHQLAVCAIFRDEAPYLDEWIRFHFKGGVRKFYLINHKSSDNYLDVLNPWIARGTVTLVHATEDDQEAEYNKALKSFGHKTRWLAFIDLDEFLFSPTKISLTRILRKFRKHPAVFVYWRLFGSGGTENPVGDRGVVRSFRQCLPPPIDLSELDMQQRLHRKIRSTSRMTGAPIQGKTIIQPARVRRVSTHWPVDFSGVVTDETGRTSETHFARSSFTSVPTTELLRVNHYWSRSLAELRLKATREPIHRGLRTNKNLKSLPEHRSEQWDQHLSGSYDTGAAEFFFGELPFVFLIGFNKSATRSLHVFFEQNGFPSVHWDHNRLVERMLENKANGDRLLYGYEDFRMFSDFTLITETDFFEGNSLFRELRRDYPSAYFILNNRPTESWIASRLSHNHGKFAALHMQVRGINTKEQLVSAWAEEKEKHELEVRAFFQGYPRFMEIQIGDPNVPKQLSRLMNKDFEYKDWSVVRKIHPPKSNFRVAGP